VREETRGNQGLATEVGQEEEVRAGDEAGRAPARPGAIESQALTATRKVVRHPPA
jgi:hypothetical protein